MQQYTMKFEGDTVEAKQCLIFKVKTDHLSENCAFCGTEYIDDLRWDVIQCVAVGGTCEIWQDPYDVCNFITCFSVCNHCRAHSNAVNYITQNYGTHYSFFLENASDDRLFKIDSYHDKNY